MAFADLTANLRLNISQFNDAMNSARKQAQRFSSDIAKVTRTGAADEMIKGYEKLTDTLHGVGLGLRDIARIASGIAISQTFYTITRSIREATQALWEFNESVDYAQVTYGALFGDSDLASNFINVLKDFSVDTIFEYQDIEGMARKLSAYGIEYKNLMYIIEGLTNIGTISGDTAALERLAVAIGQINAKGTLKAEELRQLANAYTPIYDILSEKLGITDEQLNRVGDLGIESADAINAIIDYANETFGATADAAVMTITGLKNRVVDSFKVLGSAAMAPLTTFYKSVLKFFADGLGELQVALNQGGIGAVFEKLIPSEEWQQRIRSLIASIKNTISTIIAHFMTMWPYIKQFIGGAIDALTILIGVVNIAGTAIVGALQIIGNNTPLLHILTGALVAAAGAWVLFRVQALATTAIVVLKAAIVSVAKAVVFLTTVLVKSPLITGLALFTAVLLGLSTNAKSANSAISNLINSFNSYSIGGSTAEDILKIKEAMKKTEDESKDFWQKMQDDANNTEKELDSAGKKAKSASNSLLSFDEVFRISDDNTDAPNYNPLGDIGELGGMLSGLGDLLIPDIPDLSTFTDEFADTLYTSLWDSMKTIASGGATGAIIGALVGFGIGGLVTKTMAGALTGAKWGAKIGSVVGAGFAGFWTDTYKEMEASLVNIATGASAGILVGGLLGMVIGAFATKTVDGALTGAKYGAAIGGLIGAGLGAFWASTTEEMSNAIEGILVGTGTGALIGGLTGLIIGAFSTRTLTGALTAAKIGAGIGALLGGAFGGIFGAADEELKAQIARITWASAEGMLIGGIAGMVLGAFATKNMQGALTGAKLGATIGGLFNGAFTAIFGDAEESLAERLENLFSGITAAGYGALFGGLAGMIVGAVVGAFAGGVGALPGAKIGASIGSALGGLGGFVIDSLNRSGAFEGIGEWFNNVFGAIGDWFTGVGEGIANWYNDTKESISDWADKTGEKISTWYDNTKQGISDWADETGEKVSTWYTNTKENIDTWAEETSERVSTWYTNTKENIKTWADETGKKVSDWHTGVKGDIKVWADETGKKISDWYAGAKQDISNWADETGKSVSDWYTTTFPKLSAWTSETGKKISDWYADSKQDIADWADETSVEILDWCKQTANDMSTWVSDTKKSLKGWWDAMWDPSTWKSGWDSLSTWFSDLVSDISSWFTGLGTKVSNWWNGLWDGKKASVDISATDGSRVTLGGHATGGIFNREHIARFAEGNKAEAVIPLENASAMQPFVNAISDGILQGLMPAMAGGGGGSNNLPPMYVGTLIADERGLQQLYKKFELYEAEELARKGLL